MFILSGLILEAGENLFRDFWSPFGISFNRFSVRNLKKTKPTMGRNRPGLRLTGALYSAEPAQPEAKP